MIALAVVSAIAEASPLLPLRGPVDLPLANPVPLTLGLPGILVISLALVGVIIIEALALRLMRRDSLLGTVDA